MHINIFPKIILCLLLFSVSITISATELPPIQITSSKLEETSQDSTSTINVLEKANLEIASIKSIKDLSAVISNTNISGIGNRSDKTFTIRGISNYVASESSVAIYIDDVPVPFSYGFGMVDMHNIKNIEILKGAQGTLFGKGAESGVINIYTNKPTKKFQAKASLGCGSYNIQEFYGRVSGPLANTDWSYIFAITKESSDGFSKNELTQNNFDTKDFTSFNTKLRYNPSSPLEVTLGYTKSLSDDGGSPFKINTKEDPYLIDNEPTDDSVNMDIDMLSLVMKYKTNDYTFTSATSYSKQAVLKNDHVAILGGLNMDFDINIQEIAQEFRLKQSFENSDLVVGAFYSDKLQFDYVEDQTLLSIPLSSKNSLKNPDENIALFTQYKLYIGENYSVMAGIRYQETKRSFFREMNNFAAPSTQASSETVWTHILPTLSLSYYADDDSHTYLTYSQGYRPGGYNYRSADTLVPYEPETINSLELGHKRSINTYGSLNAALFYNQIENLRVNTFDNNLANTTINAQEAYSYGAELEVNYKKDALHLLVTAGIIQTEMTQMDTNPEYEGSKIIDVPNITANIGARYALYKNYYLQSDLKYMGERYYNIQNSAKESAYTVVNLGVGYKKDGLEILTYVNNIFDERYVDFMIYTPSNDYYHFGDPRVLGFTLSQSF